MKKLLVAFLLMMGPLGLFGQDYLLGRLVDAKSAEPVVFANIILKGSSKGVISNEDGSFRIPLEFKNQYDELVISSMGYETVSVSMDTLFKKGVNVIYIPPKTFQLKETTVIGYTEKLNAKKIVKKAIKAITDNFSTEPFSIVGYYRDYQKDSLKYINLNESIVEIQDKGFGKKDGKTTDYRIYRIVKNQEFPRDSISSISYDYEDRKKIIENGYLPSYNGNELVILRVHDAIRNYDHGSYSYIDEMNKDLVRNHQFSMGQDVYLDGEWLYTVNFVTIKYNVVAKGQLMIAKKDFAIYGLQYAVHKFDENHIPKDFSDLDKLKLIFEIHSEYRPFKGKMYLTYLSFSNTFTLQLPPVFILKDIIIDPDNKVTWLELNNPLNIASTKDPDHYEIYFKEQEITFEILLGHGDPKKVLLKPLFRSEREEEMYYAMVKDSARTSVPNNIKFKIKGLRDINGNILGHSERKDYLQFREFFAQKIIPGNNEQDVGIDMDKTKPLFQNMMRDTMVDSIQGYWMNTPLKDAVQTN